MNSAGPVVLAPDKFKGSLPAAEVVEYLAAGLRRFRPGVDLRLAPVADGGDGTLQAVLARGYRLVPVRVSGPTGGPIMAGYARRADTAVVELSR